MQANRIVDDLKDVFFLENSGRVYDKLIDDLECSLIARVLKISRGNQLKSARILGINRNTLRSKIKKYDIGGLA